jgi:hypothetical protein
MGSLGASIDDPADRLIARDKRIAHSRKWRHAARPEQPLGSSADSAPRHIDYDIVVSHSIERKIAHSDLLRPIQDDSDSLHLVSHLPAAPVTKLLREHRVNLRGRPIVSIMHDAFWAAYPAVFS